MALKEILGTEESESLTGTGLGDHIIGLGGHDTIHGGSGGDSIEGGDGYDWLYGDLGGDTLHGGALNDLLEDNGVGSDWFYGEDGDDVIRIYGDQSNLNSVAFADGGDGNDEILSRGGANETSATLLGGDGDDRMEVRNVGNASIDGGSGVDTISLLGTSGTVRIGSGSDTLILLESNSSPISIKDFTAGADGDLLDASGLIASRSSGYDGSSSPFVDGVARFAQQGGTTLLQVWAVNGEVGPDPFYQTVAAFQKTAAVSLTADNLSGFEHGSIAYVGTARSDTVSGTAAGENIEGYEGKDKLFGLDGADTIDGGTGNDTIDGGAGKDRLIGGLGNDLYIVSGPGDRIVEQAGEGTDKVQTSVSLTLSGNLERLELTGTFDLKGTGNSLDNSLIGNAGDNVLIGKAGDDTLDGQGGSDELEGGKGDDRYIVNERSDVVVEADSQGTDTVVSSVSIALAANVENLELTGTAGLKGIGNGLNNTIVGNDGANAIVGGAGLDRLRGGDGADRFIFDDGETGKAAKSADNIRDFDHSEGDRIDLHKIDAIAGGKDNKFTFIGDSEFAGKAGQLRFDHYHGDTFVSGDVDGNGKADFMIKVEGLHDLVQADFVI